MTDLADRWIDAALAMQGIEIAEQERPIVRIVHEAYAPAFAALDAMDQAGLMLEHDLDPSRAPR